MSRSVAQQVAHWARIGRELERSPDVSLKAVAETLAGNTDYDSLHPREQAVARAFWAERMRTLRDQLKLDREYAAAGYAYAELNEAGKVEVRGTPRPQGRRKLDAAMKARSRPGTRRRARAS